MARSSLTRQARFFRRKITRPRSPARCDALGRRAAEKLLFNGVHPPMQFDAVGYARDERDQREREQPIRQ